MSSFSGLLKNNAEYASVEYNVKKNRLPMGVLGLSLTPKSHLIATLGEETGRKALVLTDDEASAVKMTADLETMGRKAFLYPIPILPMVSMHSARQTAPSTTFGL